MLVTTISSQNRQENYVSEQDTSSDQHQEISETKKEPDKTFCRAFWLRVRIYVAAVATAVYIAVYIAPRIRFKNEIEVGIAAAAATITLLIFIDLLIYLFAYKEELSGYFSKIFNPIKNFILHTWEKINSIKKFLKVLSILTGATLLIIAELFLIYKTFEGFSSHAAEIRNLPNDFNFSSKSDELSKIQGIRFNTFLYAIGALLLAALPALFFAKKIKSTLEKHILRTFVLTVIIGGIIAFLIPTFLYNYGFIGDTKDLTTALLGVTGGVVALFSLIKSHQKSELEREQLEVQKQKDNRDHIRQLHNSYSDRFDKAVTELNSGESKDAFAAVYKLVHLADDWLEYKDLSDNEEEQNKLKNRAKKETQTIIDILCKYIRTMPKSCTDKDLKNIRTVQGKKKNIIEKEAEVRQLIFSEIKTRTDYLKEINIPSDINAPLPEEKEPPEDSWGRYTFNFFGAPIFYSLNEMHFPNSDFSEANFYEGSSLCRTRFQKAKFVHATFFEDIKFDNAKFLGQTVFTNSIFKKDVSFYSVNFLGELHSSKIDVYGIANYSAARFYDRTIFHSAEFHKDLEGYSGTSINWQNQDYTLFKAVHTAPRQTIEWYDTKFYGYVDFYFSIFNNEALFRDVKFMAGCNFLRSTFKTADFKNSKFTGDTGFQEVTFTHLAYYNNVNSWFQKDSFSGAEYIYGSNHEFPISACLGTIPKDRNFDVGSYLYPLGSRFYKISKNGNKIYSQCAQQIYPKSIFGFRIKP